MLASRISPRMVMFCGALMFLVFGLMGLMYPDDMATSVPETAPTTANNSANSANTPIT